MKKAIIYIAIAFIFVSCTKSILLREVGLNRAGILSYGMHKEHLFYVDKRISPELELEWIAETDGSFSDGSVIVYDQYMFASDLSGNIFCFSDTSGKKLGVLKQKGEIDISPLIMRDKLIYVVNNYKENYASLIYYQFVQGRQHKEIKLPGNYKSEIIIENDGIILVSQNGHISKYNLIGEKEWDHKTDILTFSNPVLKNDIIYFASIGGEIVGFNTATKRIILREKISNRIESSPVVIENNIFIGDNNGTLYCYDLTNNVIKWEGETGSKIINQPVMDNAGNIYIGNMNGDVLSYTISGNLRWRYSSGGVINAVPLIFKNILVQPDMNKKLLVLDIQNGNLLNEISFERRVRTSPVYYNEKIYIGIDRNEIHAFKVKEL